MPNSINSLSPTFRDLLLNRNSITDTITNNGLSTLLNGIGLPADPSTQPESVQTSPDIEVDGVFHRDLDIITNKYQGTATDYEQYSVNYLPGNTNSTIGGNVWNNEPYGDPAADLIDANDGFLQLQTSKNIYLDVDKQVPVSIEYKASTFQMGSYLDENNNVNVGGPDTQPFDIASSLLNGGGVGFDPNGGGLVSNSDVRSSLGGRVLTATGIINDTRLGQLSAGYLATALGNNIAFELQENTIGRVNTNITSLIKGGNLIIPNYKITVGSGILGTAGDLLERMTGAKVPFSLLKTSIFASDDKWQTGNIARANSMLENTGKGQIIQMFSNLNANTDVELIGTGRNGFTPPFKKANNSEGGINQEEAPISGGTVYAYGKTLNEGGNIINDGPAQLIGGFNDEFEGDVLASTQRIVIPKGVDFSTFSWGDENNNYEATTFVSLNDEEGNDFGIIDSPNNFKNKNTILYKTQELFKSGRMKTLVSGQGVKNETTTQIQRDRKGFLSKGSGVLSADALLGGNLEPHEVFCRTWTTFDRYDNNLDLQKSSGLIGGENGEFPNRPFGRTSLDASVLNSTGFVNIGPTTDEETGKVDDIKRFMFSIENLAWADDLSNLLPSEKGPGDPLSGLRGRIMWFPPYDISFNESTSVNWDRSNFIGRGEPVYTYNNTERTGSLSWKVIIDHPNYANYFPKDWGNDEITSFYAGCLEYEDIRDKVLTEDEKDKIEESENVVIEEKVDEQKPETVTFNLYFPNDVAMIKEQYESGLSGSTTADTINYTTNPTGEGYGIGVYKSGPQSGGAYSNRKYTDNTNFGINGAKSPIKIGKKTLKYGKTDNEFVPTLIDYMENECKYCRIYLKGYASKQGKNKTKNQTLSDNRANSIKEFFKAQILNQDEIGDSRFKLVKGLGQIDKPGCVADGSTDTEACKKDRYTEVKIEYDPSLKPKEEASEEVKSEVKETKPPSIPTGRFFTETHYFKKIKEDDAFVYNEMKNKIKYFHPSFHSMTPEGFNSRLNFLHQCTRQGPTKNKTSNPNNLAFGRPPVCILRIGDFYHTKIVIDSMTLDYDPLVWDLNPEGVGVQPMIANVTISFAFIGGSSLEGPINKLQNAVSYNFFANTEIYDARADRIKIGGKDKNLQSNDQGKGYGELVPGEKVNSPVVPLIIPGTEDGLNNNNTSTEKDQEVVAENESKKPEVAKEEEAPSSGSTENDKKILGFIGIYGYLSPEDKDDYFILGLDISKKSDVDGPLTKAYAGLVHIVNNIDNTQSTVGIIRLRPNNQHDFIIGTDSEEKIQTYKGSTTRITLDIDSEEFDYQKIIDLLDGSGNNIRIKWACGGPRPNYGYSKALDNSI
jgi:hypothetical protein